MQKKFLNLLGIKIGHWTNTRDLTGVTAFLIEKGAHIGIDIRGAATGSHNTHAYGDVKSSLERVHAVVFAGGSSFGMESFLGVMEYLYTKGVGNRFGSETIPGITGAVIYDRLVGNVAFPTKKDGYEAARCASGREYRTGNIGAGTGATVGKWNQGVPMKGGFGMAAVFINPRTVVASFAVTNAYGDIIHPHNRHFYADCGNYRYNHASFFDDNSYSAPNTTLALTATNVYFDRSALSKIASRGHDAFARAIFPVHTTVDGDIIFAISTGTANKNKRRILTVDLASIAAEQTIIEAIKVSILHAKSVPGFPSYHDLMSM